MRKTNLLLIPCISLLAAISLHGQNAPVLNNDDQNISPLMMFTDAETESPTEKATDPRKAQDQRVKTTPTAGFSQAARGTTSGLAEEGEDESSLTLDHFRIALAKNPTATRFVIVEDENNTLSIQPRVATGGRFGPSRSENINVIDALKELLLARHNGDAEIVKSLLNENSSSLSLEIAPLSAERLENILARSDTAEQHVSDHVDLDEDYLILTWREAEESADHSISKQEWIKTRIAEGKLSPRLQSRAKSAAKHNRDEWQETRNRYSKFLEETGEGAIPDKTRQQIESLIIASNEAFKAAQEILDLLSQGDTSGISSLSHTLSAVGLSTSRASEMHDSSTRAASPQTTMLQAALNDHIQDTHATAIEAVHERIRLPRDEKGKVIDPSGENRLKVMTALKSYEEKLQQWRSDVEEKGAGKISSIKNATKAITSKLMDSLTDPLDFGTPKDKAVFWTGYNERNQDTAMSYAADQGKHTLEMTRGGSLLDGLGFFKPDSLISPNLPNALFNTASQRFAEGARGDVTAVIIEGRIPSSTYSRIERPILKRQEKEKNVKLEELKVPKKIAGLFWKQLDNQKEIDAAEISKLQQRAAEAHAKAATAYPPGSFIMEHNNPWNHLENSLLGVADKLQKAIKAKEAGKTEEAKTWGEIASLQELSIEPYTQSTRSFDDHLNLKGLCLYNRAEKLGKAIEAEAAGKPEEAQQWRKAGELYQRSGEFNNQAQASRAAQGSKSKSIYSITCRMLRNSELPVCDGAAASFYAAAEKLGRAIKAEAAEEPEEAQKWRDAAKLHQQSGELYIKAIPSRSDYDDDYRYTPFLKKAELRAAQQNAAEAYSKAAEKKYQTVVATGYQAVVAVTAWANEKTVEAQAEENSPAVEAYLQSAQSYEQQAEALVREDQAAAERHQTIAKRYQAAAKVLGGDSIALAKKRAAEAQAGKNFQAAEAYRRAAQSYEQQAEALVRGNQAAAERYQTVAEMYIEVTILLHLSASSYTQAAEAKAARREDESQGSHNAGLGFYNAAEKLVKAIEAETVEKPAKAQKYREAATLQKRYAELVSRAVLNGYSIFGPRNISEASRLLAESNTIRTQAERLEKEAAAL